MSIPSTNWRWALLAVTLMSGEAVAAQQVVGRVLERGGGGPVSGAMVRLYSAESGLLQGWLTAADGRFQLQARAAGTYQIQVERIGFSTSVIEAVTLSEGGVVSIDVVVETRPISLEGLAVEAEGGRCSVDEGGGATQALWDEARKALSAASWTERQVHLAFQVSVWDRQISPRTSQILTEQREERRTVGANSVQSLPPDSLVAAGYVQQRPGFVLYYAPDAEVLLSDPFQDTHCFRVTESDDGSAFVGLAFEPVRGRVLPDVAGVIWLDNVNGRLDRVEFRYTELGGIPGGNRARGEVKFAELQDGRWIVSEWVIQAPMVSDLRFRANLMSEPGNIIHEVGNQVESVEGDGFLWRPDIAPGVIRGAVFDSIARAPLAGAEVRVAGRNWRTNSDLDGRFELSGITPGLHRLTFGHPQLDSLGVVPGWTTVDVEPGGVEQALLVVPRWETLLARTCEQGGAVVGIVRRRDGGLLGGARVEVRGLADADGAPFSDLSDARGGFVLCGVPVGIAQVVAHVGPVESDAVEVRIGETGFVQADLTVLPSAPTVRTVPGALSPALVGTVMAQSTRQPLEDVVVRLLDEDGSEVAAALSDAEGMFRMVLDRGSVVHLAVERLGYTGAVSESLDLSDGTRRIEVLLPEEAIELDPVMVVVEGRIPRLEREGFYGRATEHPGIFIRRDDIDAVAPARTTDLLGRAPGVRVMTDPLSGDLRRRVVFNRLTLAGGERCYPTVIVDGELVRIGGSREDSGAPAIEGIEPPPTDEVPSLDELVPPHEIEAVEMYANPGQVPQRFRGLGTKCGVIVVWTKRSSG